VKNLNKSEAIPKYMFLVSYPGKEMLSFTFDLAGQLISIILLLGSVFNRYLIAQEKFDVKSSNNLQLLKSTNDVEINRKNSYNHYPQS
jgi:hypothetical protein